MVQCVCWKKTQCSSTWKAQEKCELIQLRNVDLHLTEILNQRDIWKVIMLKEVFWLIVIVIWWQKRKM